MRIRIIRYIVFILIALIAADLFYLQIVRGRYFYNLSRNNRIRLVPLEGERGRILDRNGVVLADNRPTFNAAVIPQDVEDKEKLFAFLAGVLQKDPTALKKKY